jgi:pantoate--beta-alanine ligase
MTDVLRTVAETQARCLAWRAAGLRVGLVPTMGYLHEGHLSLVRLARARADRVVVSIFVNPTQFGPDEDLARYPRDEAGDLAKLGAEGVSLTFCPPAVEMYPPGAQTFVTVERLPQHLCGLSRPTHFRGVATVVTQLFAICLPHVAVFGEKDYQQLLVIRRMTADLHLPVEIVGGPVVREPDGLAMSSRNAYLSADERRRAPALNEALGWAAAQVRKETVAVGALQAELARRIGAAGGEIDYVRIVDDATLEAVPPEATIDRPVRAAVAVFFGRTRLIDNRRLAP